jgi:pseudouridine synthase
MKNKEWMTLDRVLSRYGLSSRTTAGAAIRAGRIRVNGRVIRQPDYWVRPKQDSIQWDGKRLKPARKIYLLSYKPKGVITTHSDPSGRKTIYDLLGDFGQWVSPVGRLDKDTSGLLLLSNDTQFADFITRPDARVPKTYRVKINGLMGEDVLARLAEGVQMKRGDFAQPQAVRRIQDRGKYTWLEVVLTEGKNREVRRMMEALGFKVLKLVRTQIGSLTLAGLEVGKWRELNPEEVRCLRSGADRPHPAARASAGSWKGASAAANCSGDSNLSA